MLEQRHEIVLRALKIYKVGVFARKPSIKPLGKDKMFESVKRLFRAPEKQPKTPDTNIAVAALLVHLAAIDGIVTKDEQHTIAGILQDHFKLGPNEVKHLIDEATSAGQDAVDFYQFTSSLSKLDEQERIDIVRLMWRVVFADGHNHELEDNMVWRVAELIHVSARERAMLRKEIKQTTNPE